MKQFKKLSWSNPKEIGLTQPYIYLIKVKSPKCEYRYIGKGSSPSRMNAHRRNISKLLSGQPKRPAIKRNGEPQSTGNIRYRFVHLVLGVTVKHNWIIEHFPLENCEKHELNRLESKRILELNCDMNSGKSWFIDEFQTLLKTIE